MRTSLLALTVAAAALAVPAAAEYHAGAGAADWIGTGPTGHTYCLEAIELGLSGAGAAWRLVLSGHGLRAGGDILMAFRCAAGPRYDLDMAGTPATGLAGSTTSGPCTVRVALHPVDAATVSVFAEELCPHETWTLYGRAALTRI